MGGYWMVRVNGRGNAWPIPLGQDHPFYTPDLANDYANASFSILMMNDRHLEAEVLVDAGHGIVPFLLKNNNRIPEAVVLTHPHFDHILGLDWIVQSHYRFREKTLYPVYSTRLCWERVLKTIPHLESLVLFHELKFGVPSSITDVNGLELTAYPVYHGESAPGASMVLFRHLSASGGVLFSGDLLVPLLLKKDLLQLSGVEYLFVDANNRFPYPRTNHWSMVHSTSGGVVHDSYSGWKKEISLERILAPHALPKGQDPYLSAFAEEWEGPDGLITNLLQWISATKPRRVLPIHYSGQEDQVHYNEPILTAEGLESWFRKVMHHNQLESEVVVPEIGSSYRLQQNHPGSLK